MHWSDKISKEQWWTKFGCTRNVTQQILQSSLNDYWLKLSQSSSFSTECGIKRAKNHHENIQVFTCNPCIIKFASLKSYCGDYIIDRVRQRKTGAQNRSFTQRTSEALQQVRITTPLIPIKHKLDFQLSIRRLQLVTDPDRAGKQQY